MATLAAQTPGSLVKISENGALVNFLVLCHDYPAQGRTLLLRNDLYDTRAWVSRRRMNPGQRAVTPRAVRWR